MLKRLIYGFAALATVLSTVLSLTACNTIQGAGRDIERGGQAIQDEAKETKQKM
jgi:predicted small secreted protein